MKMSTAVIQTNPTRGEHRSSHLGFAQWPAGTTALAFEIWVALAVSYYMAFALELNSAASVGTGLLILVGPSQGMVLSKAIYRVAGTLFGAVAAIILTSLFPQDRIMLIVVFSAYMACLVAIATLLRDFRAYGCVLAGYTVAVVAVLQIDTPQNAFAAGVNRGAAIVVGVAALALVSDLFAAPNVHAGLSDKLAAAQQRVRSFALAILRGESARPIHLANLLREITALHPDITALVAVRGMVDVLATMVKHGRIGGKLA